MSDAGTPRGRGLLERYFDREGRLRVYPAKRSKQMLVLAYLAAKFELGRRYSEPEMNAILASHHTFADWALLRRELFDAGYFDRTDDGRVYWLVEGVPSV